MKERIAELEKILGEICGTYEADCSKCPKKDECEEYMQIHVYGNSRCGGVK